MELIRQFNTSKHPATDELIPFNVSDYELDIIRQYLSALLTRMGYGVSRLRNDIITKLELYYSAQIGDHANKVLDTKRLQNFLNGARPAPTAAWILKRAVNAIFGTRVIRNRIFNEVYSQVDQNEDRSGYSLEGLYYPNAARINPELLRHTVAEANLIYVGPEYWPGLYPIFMVRISDEFSHYADFSKQIWDYELSRCFVDPETYDPLRPIQDEISEKLSMYSPAYIMEHNKIFEQNYKWIADGAIPYSRTASGGKLIKRRSVDDTNIEVIHFSPMGLGFDQLGRCQEISIRVYEDKRVYNNNYSIMKWSRFNKEPADIKFLKDSILSLYLLTLHAEMSRAEQEFFLFCEKGA